MAFDSYSIALQSLKEFYEDQRGRYQSSTELEMRVYHRLIHIRDQKERHDDIPKHIQLHPVFKLTTDFRLHVQRHSATITKTSKLVVTDEGMQIFSDLAAVLIEQGNTVMVYLVACILERLFGKDTIEDIESLRGGMTISEIIDGTSTLFFGQVDETHKIGGDEIAVIDRPKPLDPERVGELQTQPIAPTPHKPTSPQWLANGFPGPSAPTTATSTASNPGNAFSGLVSQPNVFGTTNVFGSSTFSVSPSKPATSAFGVTNSSQNIFGGRTTTSSFSLSAMPTSPAQTSNLFSNTEITTMASPSVLMSTSTSFGQYFIFDSFRCLNQKFRCKSGI